VEVEQIVIIQQVKLKNWFSSSDQLDAGLNPLDGATFRPTGAGKECVAQKHREELAETVRKISSEPSR
jgi:hypothetical protein